MLEETCNDSPRVLAGSQPSALDLMHRATVCLWPDALAEEAEFAAWRAQWKSELAFVSHDYGCGGYVHLYDILGSKDSIAAIPTKLRILSAWTNDD